jgi:thioredoxin reductase (NADPH)
VNPSTGAWDCIIVGAGPAGLSAAVYMGRFRRRTLVVDSGTGRWSYGQHNDNYLGFPDGLSARKLHNLGRKQAERFGVSFEDTTVTSVSREEGLFRLVTTTGERTARSLIWAAGVRDRWPSFPGARKLVGRHLFWCLVCDGWRTRGKKLVVLGNDRKAAGTTLQFLTYTQDITLVVDPREYDLEPRARRKLVSRGITIVTGRVDKLHPKEGTCGTLELRDGTTIDADIIFSLYGSTPQTELICTLGVDLASNGHVRIDDKNRTSLEMFYAAGDVTNKHSHQVVSAAHEGAQAAQAANFFLYGSDQRLPPVTSPSSP